MVKASFYPLNDIYNRLRVDTADAETMKRIEELASKIGQVAHYAEDPPWRMWILMNSVYNTSDIIKALAKVNDGG